MLRVAEGFARELAQRIEVGLGRSGDDVGVGSGAVDHAAALGEAHRHVAQTFRAARDGIDAVKEHLGAGLHLGFDASLRAIEAGRYYEIPSMPYNWLSNPPSLNMLLGVWWLGNLLYPQYYAYDMVEKTQEMFRLLWSYDLSADEARAMLANSTLKGTP